MYGQLSMMNNLNGDATERRHAMKLFDNLRNKARRQNWLASLTGRAQRMAQLDATTRTGRYEGIQLIPLKQIDGSENRIDEFDAQFRPLADHIEQRWVSVATAYLRGTPLPPIEVLRRGDSYYVRDGHHRISVYRAFGQNSIEAEVTVVG